jgi:D-alanyl-D-alanine carboxypeptidase
MKFRGRSAFLAALLGGLMTALDSEGAGWHTQGERKPAAERAESSSVETFSMATKSAPAFSAPALAAFAASANQNRKLQTSLVWAFGGRTQRGWALYAPLIARLAGCDCYDPSGREFAMRVSVWQKENGIDPTGVLDGRTWSRMVSTFQSQRMKHQAAASESQLITIPLSDSFDRERPEELRKVDRETYAAYKRMMAAAAADPSLGLAVSPDGQLAEGERFLKIISAFRSREYQDQLRKQSPNSGRAGLAVNSPHFTGRALDLYVGGEPVSTKDQNRSLQTQTPVYRWLVKNAARFGFRPYFYEPWHWEYAGK